jgi:hypothetical protein
MEFADLGQAAQRGRGGRVGRAGGLS